MDSSDIYRWCARQAMLKILKKGFTDRSKCTRRIRKPETQSVKYMQKEKTDIGGHKKGDTHVGI